MDGIQHDTVLLVCSDPEFADHALRGFFLAGYPVVGPVATAGMALTLAAQAAPKVALVARPLIGRRNARDLARALMQNWGIHSLVLDEAVPDAGLVSHETASWQPPPGETSRLLGVLRRRYDKQH